MEKKKCLRPTVSKKILFYVVLVLTLVSAAAWHMIDILQKYYSYDDNKLIAVKPEYSDCSSFIQNPKVILAYEKDIFQRTWSMDPEAVMEMRKRWLNRTEFCNLTSTYLSLKYLVELREVQLAADEGSTFAVSARF